MRVIAIDQARHCGWSVWDLGTKELVQCGAFSFAENRYSYEQMLPVICDEIDRLMVEHDAAAVFIEDIQLQRNVDSFKRLGWLQGALISWFQRNEYLYDVVPPSRWQGFCGARGRTTKEIKSKVREIAKRDGKRASKILSVQFVKDRFGIDTEDDNLADAVCIGYWVVNNVTIRRSKNERM